MMSDLIRGASAPLFDRLSGAEADSASASWLLLPEQLQASIGRELARLFNTRARLPQSEYMQGTGTVLDYGIPDFSALSPRRGDDVELLEAALTQAISFYEPRLLKPSVKISSVSNRANAAVARIDGEVSIGLKAQRITFELQIDTSSTT
ncbi:MAG: type VI secretion system baseplate subunit TssE [Ramlibacter sp.]|nr:type VI secretion system baseplate subunit TssE [Ramlibacter sp.]